MEVKIPEKLRRYFQRKINENKIASEDYSLTSAERNYSVEAVKLYTRQLNKLNRQNS